MIPFDIPQNYDQYLEYAPLFIFAIVTALLSTPFVGYIARRLKILGYPPSMRDGRKQSDFRHLEKQPTPLLGGLAVLIPFFVLTLINQSPSQEITVLLIAVGILAIMGVIDDMHELSGFVQLAVQILAALFIAISVIDIAYINNPLGGIIPLDSISLTGSLGALDISFLIPGDLLLIAWLIVCTLSVKISSGTDGLMEGNSFIATMLFFLLSVRYQNEMTATVSIIFAGLIFGFLFFNFYPAKIWSGSSGKSTYGFILAVLSVISGAKIATAIIILLLPITDFFFVFINRYRNHKPDNIFKLLSISDRTHLHHRLLELGLSERRVAFAEYMITGILGVIALALAGTMKASIFMGLVVMIAGLIWGVTFYISQRSSPPPPKPPEKESPEAKYSY